MVRQVGEAGMERTPARQIGETDMERGSFLSAHADGSDHADASAEVDFAMVLSDVSVRRSQTRTVQPSAFTPGRPTHRRSSRAPPGARRLGVPPPLCRQTFKSSKAKRFLRSMWLFGPSQLRDVEAALELLRAALEREGFHASLGQHEARAGTVLLLLRCAAARTQHCLPRHARQW